jgi:hypothetical protein
MLARLRFICGRTSYSHRNETERQFVRTHTLDESCTILVHGIGQMPDWMGNCRPARVSSSGLVHAAASNCPVGTIIWARVASRFSSRSLWYPCPKGPWDLSIFGGV